MKLFSSWVQTFFYFLQMIQAIQVLRFHLLELEKVRQPTPPSLHPLLHVARDFRCDVTRGGCSCKALSSGDSLLLIVSSLWVSAERDISSTVNTEYRSPPRRLRYNSPIESTASLIKPWPLIAAEISQQGYIFFKMNQVLSYFETQTLGWPFIWNVVWLCCSRKATVLVEKNFKIQKSSKFNSVCSVIFLPLGWLFCLYWIP